ncbi:MAG: carboxypeptidase-like regulatory domain-containing protein [Gammaproteobacteria bacterium]|nr:carboxypeptidase-like regulatory domain-containing protein [Gammaproteobacteria bacterium]MDH3466566.1 carboxypeptidase-like regulatory domain-containing protein [Gammaproteobacteria bacterium]
MKSRNIRRAVVIAVGCAGLLLQVTPATATHEADHRFTVFGTVQDTNDQVLVDEPVTLSIDGNKAIANTTTDEKGEYHIRLHVHNDDLGKIFDLSVRDDTRKVRVLFNPEDRQSERGTRVNFVVTPRTE